MHTFQTPGTVASDCFIWSSFLSNLSSSFSIILFSCTYHLFYPLLSPPTFPTPSSCLCFLPDLLYHIHRLMNICHGVIGQSEADPGRRASKLVQCVLLAPDGRLLTLEVPFHLALRY